MLISQKVRLMPESKRTKVESVDQLPGLLPKVFTKATAIAAVKHASNVFDAMQRRGFNENLSLYRFVGNVMIGYVRANNATIESDDAVKPTDINSSANDIVNGKWNNQTVVLMCAAYVYCTEDALKAWNGVEGN